MKPGSFLAAVSGTAATVANYAQSIPLEKWAAVVGILAGAASFAVSIKNLLIPAKPAPHVA